MDVLKHPMFLASKIEKVGRERLQRCRTHLLMRMTIVVMIAARKTKPPKTPKAMIPPAKNMS